VVVLLLVNCGVIAGYLLLTGGGTPYSSNQWLVTEVFTVPVVEETVWRGVVFTLLLLALRRVHDERSAGWWAIILSGVAFGLMHGLNALTGAPLAFVAPQVLNATIWGLVYGYARYKTDSVYPPMLLHGAMNLIVVLFYQQWKTQPMPSCLRCARDDASRIVCAPIQEGLSLLSVSLPQANS
jgi:membrane protease YdiL (CAAX protease family)